MNLDRSSLEKSTFLVYHTRNSGALLSSLLSVLAIWALQGSLWPHMPHLWQFGVILGCSRALLWHFQMGLKVPLHQSGCIPPRSNQDTGSTTNMGPPGMTISSYTHFGQFGPNWGLPGAPQAPKSGPRRKKMWALCSSIITKSIKTNETVSAMKNNHGTKSSKYWPTPHCAGR